MAGWYIQKVSIGWFGSAAFGSDGAGGANLSPRGSGVVQLTLFQCPTLKDTVTDSMMKTENQSRKMMMEEESFVGPFFHHR